MAPAPHFYPDEPNPDRLSLRVDWIDYTAFAGELDTCMYGGGIKNEEGSLIGWRHLNGDQAAGRMYLMAVKQDIRRLDHNIVGTMKRTLRKPLFRSTVFRPEISTGFCPIIHRLYFKDKFYQGMRDIDFEIPYERWFTNLSTTGNTGAAAIYIIMAELLHSGKLKGKRQVALLYSLKAADFPIASCI